MSSRLFLTLALFGSASALAGQPIKSAAVHTARGPQLRMTGAIGRRAVLSLAPAAALLSTCLPSAHAEAGPKVVVVGGAGYVGAYIDQILLKEGYSVVSVARSAPTEQAEKVQKILGAPLAVDYQSLDASTADLSAVFKGASAVISCVGIAPGGSNMLNGNGAVNVRIADAAKAAGVERFVYLGVASELANGPAKFLFGDYVKGKAQAEAAVAKDFGDAALVIKPGVIAGGPPGEIRPPGPPGMTAASVEAVARAAVAGALGKKSGVVDGNVAINAF